MENIIWIIWIAFAIGIGLATMKVPFLSRFTLSSRIKLANERMKERTNSFQLFKHGKQIQCSKEGPLVIGELVTSYNLNQHNMVETINYTVENLKGASCCRKLLMELLPVLNQSQSEEKVAQAIKTFEEKIGTNWAKNLGQVIYCGHVMGLDVEEALLDLLSGIKRSKALEEYSQRKNNEARLMVKWLTPLSYLATMAIAISFFDISFDHFLANQLTTPVGFGWLIIVVILYLVTIMLYESLTKRKLDL